MSTKHVWIGLLALSVGLGGCDQINEKLGLGGKKEKADKDDGDKKKDKDDEEEEEEKPSASASAAIPASAPVAATPPPSGPIGKAASHLPQDCEVVVTLNLQKAFAHPAFSSKVVPAIEESIQTARTSGKDAAKLDGFLTETGIGAKSFHDFALCVKDTGSKPRFGLAAAGDFKPDGLVDAFLKGDPSVQSKVKDLNGRKAITDAEFTLGQFGDGSIGFTQGEDLFQAMGNTGDAATSKYLLPTDKEIAFAVAEGVLEREFNKPGNKPPPAALTQIKSMSGALDLAGNKIALRLATPNADEAKKVEALLMLMKDEVGRDANAIPMGGGDVLKAATTKLEGREVVVETAIPPATVDMLAAMMADSIKKEAATMELPIKGDGTDPAASAAATTTPPPTPTATTKPAPTATTTSTAKPPPTATATATAKPTATTPPPPPPPPADSGKKRPPLKIPPLKR